MRWTTRCFLISLLATPGCYGAQIATLQSDTDGGGGTDTSGPMSGTPTATTPTTADAATSSAMATGDPSMTTMTTMTAGPTTTESSESSESSTGETELGPRIIDSLPRGDDLAAPIEDSFFLYFDRLVSPSDAVAKITVSQGGNAAVPVSPLPCPGDDPTCIMAKFPASFLVDWQLPAGTDHEIVVAADFPDPDGRTNTVDQVVSFTTFTFDNNVFDDTAFYDANRMGGLAFDPDAEMLYLVGVAGGSCAVRQIPVPSGVLGSATTVATLTGGGTRCDGLDLYAGQLLVPLGYGRYVHVFDDLGAPTFDGTGFQIGPATTLEEPHAQLAEVWGAAFVEGRYIFSFGNFVATENGTGLVDLVLPDTWSLLVSGEGLWRPPEAAGQGVGFAVGQIGGTNTVFAHGGDSIHQFALSDGALMGSNAIGRLLAPDVHVDEFERVYLGGSSGSSGKLTVLDGNDLSVIATRTGLDTGRIAVSATPDRATVYYLEFLREAIVGRLVIDF